MNIEHPDTSEISSSDHVSASSLPLPDLAASSAPQFELTSEGVVLLGTRFRASGVGAFPARELCPVTGRRDGEQLKLGPLGRLYSFSAVHVSSLKKTPYTIGYVDFANGVRVLAEVRGDTESLRCDSLVRLDSASDDWFVVPVTEQEAA